MKIRRIRPIPRRVKQGTNWTSRSRGCGKSQQPKSDVEGGQIMGSGALDMERTGKPPLMRSNATAAGAWPCSHTQSEVLGRGLLRLRRELLGLCGDAVNSQPANEAEILAGPVVAHLSGFG